MSTALDYVRNSCGMAGEEIADMVDSLEAEVAMLKNRSSGFSSEQKERFELRARDLMQWLCANGNPHMTIIITTTTAELLGGEIAIHSNDYVRG